MKDTPRLGTHRIHSSDAPEEVGSGVRLHAAMLKRRLIGVVPPWIVVMALSMIPAWQFTSWQWVVAALSLPVVVWGAWPFHRAAFQAGRHGSTTMDTLVSLGVIASTLWSWWALLFGGAGHLGMRMSMSLLPRAGTHAEIYFEGACTITVFLLLGRFFEARTRYLAGDALRALLQLGAKRATLVHVEADGTRSEHVIPAEQLSKGDLFVVRPGEKVATDGQIVEGDSAMDASLLTGESLPQDVHVGDQVTGATVNTWGTLLVRATRVGSDTTLAQIGRMVTQAQAGKAPVQRLADQISAVFVPIVIGVAILTLIGWLLAGGSLQAAFTAAVSVLVVACPCALGLATPTALLVGSGRASQLGILIKSAEVLEQSRSIDTVILDKTGTVTTGVMTLDQVKTAGAVSDGERPNAASERSEAASERPAADVVHHSGSEPGFASAGELVNIPLGDSSTNPSHDSVTHSAGNPALDPAPGSEADFSVEQAGVLALAAGAETGSEHPIARAIVDGAHSRQVAPAQVSGFTNHAGLGVSVVTGSDTGYFVDLTGDLTKDLPNLAAKSIWHMATRDAQETPGTPSTHTEITAIANSVASKNDATHTHRGQENNAGQTSLILVGRPSWIDQLGITIPQILRDQAESAENTGASVVMVARVPHWADQPAAPAILPAEMTNHADAHYAAAETSTPSDLHVSPDRSQVLAVSEPSHLSATDPGLITVDMQVLGMTCASCVNRVERKLKKLPGVHPSVNLATESATITLEQEYSDEQLEQIVNNAGYEGHVRTRTQAISQDSAGLLDDVALTSPHVAGDLSNLTDSRSLSFAQDTADPAYRSLTNGLTSSKAMPTDQGSELLEHGLDLNSSQPFALHSARNGGQRQLPEHLDGDALGILIVRDHVKESSAPAIQDLRNLGVEPVLLTGDNQAAADHVAGLVGISHVIAGVLPADKRDQVKTLQNQGKVVAMVGDGVNDAAALAQASARGLGMAMGSGTDIAMQAADMTLVNSDLRSVAVAIRISRRTLRIIKQNLFWAFFYNVCMIPLAVAGMLNPMLAAAAMACSSVFVVLNSLRLRSAR